MFSPARRRCHSGAAPIAFAILLSAGCTEIPRASTKKNDIASMRTVQVEITGRTTFTTYVADQADTIQLGLMNVARDELPDGRGMIFVFDYDRPLSFWMRNTIIPLDIAYVRSDGTIVKTYTMEPHNEAGYPSIEPARFAVEVNAGEFARWGVREGDRVQILTDVSSGSKVKNDLAKMRTVPIEIPGRTTYTAYVADTWQTREVGLMNVTEADLPEDRGMIFVFDEERELSFWMRNTIIPLDIAYINSDGLIIKTHTMKPLDESSYYSQEPARFALEVRGGQFAKWGVKEGDRVIIPPQLQALGGPEF